MLQRRGILAQGTTVMGEVFCADGRGATLLLTPLSQNCPLPARNRPCQLRLTDAGGILQLTGAVTGADEVIVNGIAQPVLRFELEADAVTHINRRSSFRVGVTLKGELAVFDAEELASGAVVGDPGTGNPPTAQRKHVKLAKLIRSRKQPCLVVDLSIGGVRLSVSPPAPRAGQVALLDLGLSRDDVLHNLSAVVVRGGRGSGRGEFGASARLRFDTLPGKTESRLARLVSEVQLQTLRRGVRDRR